MHYILRIVRGAVAKSWIRKTFYACSLMNTTQTLHLPKVVLFMRVVLRSLKYIEEKKFLRCHRFEKNHQLHVLKWALPGDSSSSSNHVDTNSLEKKTSQQGKTQLSGCDIAVVPEALLRPEHPITPDDISIPVIPHN